MSVNTEGSGLKSQFEITRRYTGGVHVAKKMPVDASRGMAVMINELDPTSFSLATGRLDGFLTRVVQTGGPVLGDLVYPNRIELPFTTGQEASAEHADEYECEDPYIQLSGTGSISSSTRRHPRRSRR